jgi:RHS repeat-associated protein
MRTARLICLAALSALATMACLGSPAASAATLCSVKENPCPGAFEYKAGTKIEAVLAAGNKATFTTSLGTVTCLSSTIGGETTSAGGKEKVVEAKVSTLTFASCKLAETACTLTAVHLPYSASFTALEGIEALTLEHSEGVGVSAKCGAFISCTYTAKRVELKMVGGNPATLTVSGLPLEGGGAFCGTKPTFTAKYEVLQPKPAFVVAQAPAERSFTAEEGYGRSNPGEPNVLRSWAGPSVNAASGNLVESQTDLVLGGRGPTLEVTRTFNSLLAASQEKPGPFGYGWIASFGASLTIDEKAATATVHQGDGSAVVFYLVEGKYFPGPWVQATLTKSGTSYVYTLPNQTALEFNSSGQLLKETDRHGNAITLAYNGKSQLETATDAAGRKITFAYNAEGQVESAKDPMGRTAKYSYESGKLATVTLPGEEKARWKFAYNAAHQITSETDGRGNAIATEYDASHRVEWQKFPLERKRSLKYEAGKSTATEPNGATTVGQFNAAGEPTSIALASGTGIEAVTTSEYNTSYQLLTLTDPNKHATKYTYDGSGNRTSEKDANSNEAKWTYNATHDVLTATTPKGETTTFIRNATGDAETIERPAPSATVQKTTFKYAKNGDMESETDALSRTTSFEYDTYGDRKTETNAAGDKRTWAFNEDSQLTSEVSPRGYEEGSEAVKFESKIERDAQGRPLTVTDPLGHTTKYVYDANGNLETLTDSKSHITTFTYDADNERTKVKKPNGATSETGYDSMGEVTSRTDGNAHTRKLERDLLERVIEEIDPLERKTIRKYDTAGNLKELTDPAKRTTTLTYDAGNRLTKIGYSEEATHAVTYEYDKDGNVTVMTDGTGTVKSTYDQLNRLTEAENGNKEIIKYEYNLGNEQTNVTYPNGKSISRGFDKAGRLEKVVDWLSGESKFSYNRDSELKAITFPTAAGDKDEYEYDATGRISKATFLKGAETLASLSYARDKDGNVESVTQKGLPGEEKVEYAYDENDRLSKGGKTAYKYDPANSPTTIGEGTYTYDKASQLEKGAGTTYAFDTLGERTKATPSVGPATTYGYNQAGNLISIKRPEEGKTAKIEDTYGYDGNGLRMSQTITGATTHLAWDSSRGRPQLLADGTNSYIYGPGEIPFEQINGEGKAVYLHHDQQGSIRMLTGATGGKEGAYSYGPYGSIEEHTGTATTPLDFTGHYTSSDTGLIYTTSGVLDPATAQFLGAGPAVGSLGAPYSYASDNPISGGVEMEAQQSGWQPPQGSAAPQSGGWQPAPGAMQSQGGWRPGPPRPDTTGGTSSQAQGAIPPNLTTPSWVLVQAPGAPGGVWTRMVNGNFWIWDGTYFQTWTGTQWAAFDRNMQPIPTQHTTYFDPRNVRLLDRWRQFWRDLFATLPPLRLPMPVLSINEQGFLVLEWRF